MMYKIKRHQVGLFLCITFVASFFIVNPYYGLGNPDIGLEKLKNIFTAISAFSGSVLWIWMLADFFKRRDTNNRFLWGWSFLIFLFITAAIYFLVVYLPREKKFCLDLRS
jgi:multisubunit Na+/H+ antiporter MnhB subunit